MGKYCFICHRERPHEAFSGRGHGIGICKKCGGLPKSERQRIQDEEFLYNALEQKNISKKNVESFKEMCLRYSDELGEKAALMVELGAVHPRKKKRDGFLYHNKRELYDRMVHFYLIEEWVTEDFEAMEEEVMNWSDGSLKEDAESEALFYKEYVRDEDIPF
jgi:hypothetical protein